MDAQNSYGRNGYTRFENVIQHASAGSNINAVIDVMEKALFSKKPQARYVPIQNRRQFLRSWALTSLPSFIGDKLR